MTFLTLPVSQANYLEFIRTAMGITDVYLPDNSDWVTITYEVAAATVNPQFLQSIVARPIYPLMLYNLGGDLLINWAQDLPGVYVTNPSPPPAQIGYFALLRQQFKINNFTAGVVSASSDEGSSVSLEVIDSLKSLTLDQLSNLNTPYGRTYLGYAQKLGSLWGLT